jgi:hypothetical protein
MKNPVSFKNLRTPALLMLIFIPILLVYYFYWVQGKRSHLMSRNFRLLATIGSQIDESITGQVKIIESFVRDPSSGIRDKRVKAGKLLPGLELEELVEPTASGKSQFGLWTAIPYWEHDSRGEWLRIHYNYEYEKEPRYRARLKLERILTEVVQRETNGMAFDAILLATTEGRVIFQQGDPELRLTRLDKLIEPGGNDRKTPQFDALSRATSAATADISGVKFRLFIQPCCSTLRQALQKPEPTPDPGLIICGLVSEEKLTYSSLAISFSLMALTSAVILLAIFSWPFLKLTLIGEQQRVRMIDVALVGLCGLLGISLMTIFLLDLWAYSKLKDDLKKQLEEFSQNIEKNMREEVQLAYQQMKCLESTNTNADCRLLEEQQDQTVNSRLACIQENMGARKFLYTEGQKPITYPFFNWFSIDRDGKMTQNCTWDRQPTPRIPVNDRQYFSDALAGRTWPLPPASKKEPIEKSERYVLESIRSRTTGTERAVMAAPSKSDGSSVMALSIPMRSLIKPIVMPGFGFAIIDAQGRVLFHSDSQRNLLENFFAEADGDRKLRAVVSARRSEVIDLRYWGHDYSARVTPFETLPEVPWFLITFGDKQLSRTLNVEWLVTALLFLAIYAGIYILIGLIIALIRPTYRATWLWPAPERRADYSQLSLIYVALLTCGGIPLALLLRGFPLLLAAWSFPFGVWLLTFVILRRGSSSQSSRSPGQLPLLVSYTIFGVLLLALVAVLPTVAFFKTAYDIHMNAFVKYGQLNFALALEKRAKQNAESVANLLTERRDLSKKEMELVWQNFDEKRLDRYCRFFYHTESSSSAQGAQPPEYSQHTSLQGSIERWLTVSLTEFIEAQLPYYSDLSIQWHELLHDGASDETWYWCRVQGNQLCLHKKQSGGQSLLITSDVPKLFDLGWYTSGFNWSLFFLIVIVLMILLLLLWMVRFICRRIFLIDLELPMWKNQEKRLQINTGYNLFLICRREELKNQLFVREVQPQEPGEQLPYNAGYKYIDMKKWDGANGNDDSWRERLSQMIADLDPGRSVIIDNFEHRMYDRALNQRKLHLMEELIHLYQRTVVVLSRTDPASLLVSDSYSAETDKKTGDDALSMEKRWAQLLLSFHWIDADRLDPAPIAQQVSESVVDSEDKPEKGGVRRWIRVLKNWVSPPIAGQIEEESSRDQVLILLWKELKPLADVVEPDRLRQEYDDRVANYYHRLWSSCTSNEKLVLRHLAEDGFVNSKDRKTIRRLIARGFIRREPHFQLLNGTFRRFVLTASCPAVEELFTSTWDSIKRPFLAVVAVTSAFFFITQQEIFNVTIAAITGMTAALPVFLKLISLLRGKQTGSGANAGEHGGSSA